MNRSVVFAVCLIVSVVTAFAGDPKSVGDVVGRDLKGWEVYSWLGHVGIYDGSKVLEALNDAACIHKDSSITSFKTASSSFWGAKWYDDKKRYWKVIDAGWSQRNWSPSWTPLSIYTEGGMVKKKVWNPKTRKFEEKLVQQNASFRCDSFVFFSYKKGIGVNLNGFPDLPITLYRRMPNSR